MHLGTPGDDLVKGLLIKRYKRFLADCQLESGKLVTAHCPNTGSMKTLLGENRPVWLKTHNSSRRKLPFTLTLLGVDHGGWALIDTSLPNHIVKEGIIQDLCPPLSGYSGVQSEVPYGSRRSRIDLLLTDRNEGFSDRRACYVEIKNVTMASQTHKARADFPDSCTERGKKHLWELRDMVAEGYRCVQYYLLGRTDRSSVGIADDIDPEYAGALREALAQGVEVVCQRVDIADGEAVLGAMCPFDFE